MDGNIILYGVVYYLVQFGRQAVFLELFLYGEVVGGVQEGVEAVEGVCEDLLPGSGCVWGFGEQGEDVEEGFGYCDC